MLSLCTVTGLCIFRVKFHFSYIFEKVSKKKRGVVFDKSRVKTLYITGKLTKTLLKVTSCMSMDLEAMSSTLVLQSKNSERVPQGVSGIDLTASYLTRLVVNAAICRDMYEDIQQ